MESVAIVVTAVIAVGGWLASGALARRAMRRQLRVEYLLSAYRRLEAASNRAMTADHEVAIEAAVSEVQLLGTRAQVDMADQFALAFAAGGFADSGPLLEELRTSLRTELLLKKLPERGTWLRITRDGQWAQERALVQARVPMPPSGFHALEADAVQNQVVGTTSSKAILSAYAMIAARLRDRLGDHGGVPADATASDLACLALETGVITSDTAEAVRGITVMRNLAAHGTKDVSAKDAQDFVALVEAVLYAIDHGA